MANHTAPRRAHNIGERLTVPAIHLILGLPRPIATDAGQPGRHHEESAR